MWHLIGAVMLMTIAMGVFLITLLVLLGDWLELRQLAYTGVSLLGAITFILVTPTFLITRGRSRYHSFLIKLNLLAIVAFSVMLVGTLFFDQGTLASTVAVGLIASSGARLLYKSAAHHECVEYYRVIWSGLTIFGNKRPDKGTSKRSL